MGDRVMFYIMPKEVSGKDCKLARPFHGTFRIVNLTHEVQLMEKPEELPLFVTIDQLCKCYMEMSDESWTGSQLRGH